MRKSLRRDEGASAAGWTPSASEKLILHVELESQDRTSSTSERVLADLCRLFFFFFFPPSFLHSVCATSWGLSAVHRGGADGAAKTHLRCSGKIFTWTDLEVRRYGAQCLIENKVSGGGWGWGDRLVCCYYAVITHVDVASDGY